MTKNPFSCVHPSLPRIALFILLACGPLHADTNDHFITVHGARIHYLERGQGPVVVLVHGLADDAHTWQTSLDALSKNYRVLAPDLIGHGSSDKPLLNYRPQTFTDFLTGFLDALKIERATLVGNSLGGWTVALVALEQPQRVERLVLVDSAGFADQKLPACLNPATLAEAREVLHYVFADPKLADSPVLAGEILQARVVRNDGYTIARFLESAKRNEDALDGRLGALKMPTLIVWGEQDKLIPPPNGQRFAREIPGAKLHLIPNCGHDAQFECPQPFNLVLLEFLGEKSENRPVK